MFFWCRREETVEGAAAVFSSGSPLQDLANFLHKLSPTEYPPSELLKEGMTVSDVLSSAEGLSAFEFKRKFCDEVDSFDGALQSNANIDNFVRVCKRGEHVGPLLF